MTRRKTAAASGAAPSRVVIENVRPQVEGGRFAIKRTVGERVEVTADAFTDGHDELRAILQHKPVAAAAWEETPMRAEPNDVWRGAFPVDRQEPYVYCVMAWIDRFRSWRRDFSKKVAAGSAAAVDILAGARLVAEAGDRARGQDARSLHAWAKRLESEAAAVADSSWTAPTDEALLELMDRNAERFSLARYERELPVTVDRERARFSAWYEMFPRSCAAEPGRHGTLKDCEERLGYVAEMGFDVVYLPPIHPIGASHRKGRNNAVTAEPGDVGSPWAIGAADGGHTKVHSELGTLEDFRSLVERARALGMEIALDYALQCSPDHPYVREHPEWFYKRPDGTIQYAENPPKKYQDVYPLNFECDGWREMWEEMKAIVLFWIEQGVKIFRVDNPHTKPFAFWEWLIAEIRKAHPDVLFLSEAFTRPKVMYRLAKLGFTQSYTYFAWRNTKWELTQYFTEMARDGVREFFRPNLWPNTPDILTEQLQFGGRTGFQARAVLAATLGASYGVYGPAFELMEHVARSHGSEEYLDSEKYQVRHWDLRRADSLSGLIGRLNRIRRDNPALHADGGLRFHPIDNEQLLAYSKATHDLESIILVVVNLDPHHRHSGWLELPIDELGLPRDRAYQVHDLLSDGRYLWSGPRNYVEIDPAALPAHVFRLRRWVRTERDFDYFL